MIRVGKVTVHWEGYVLRIGRPSVTYALSLQTDRRRVDAQPVEEHFSVHFETECLSPARFKGRLGTATVYPDPQLGEGSRPASLWTRRAALGHIRGTKNVFEIVLYVPPELCWSLAEAVGAGVIRSLLTNGHRETLGLNRVRSISFYGPEFDPVEYLG